MASSWARIRASDSSCSFRMTTTQKTDANIRPPRKTSASPMSPPEIKYGICSICR